MKTIHDLIDKINKMESFECLDGETNDLITVKLEAKFEETKTESFWDRTFTVTDGVSGNVIISRGQRISSFEMGRIANPEWSEDEFFKKALDAVFGSMFSTALFVLKYKFGSNSVAVNIKSKS